MPDIDGCVVRCPQGWYPDMIPSIEGAAAKYDWGLLVVTLAVLLEKENLGPVMQDERRMSRVKVVERCRAVGHTRLLALLQQIVGWAGWDW